MSKILSNAFLIRTELTVSEVRDEMNDLIDQAQDKVFVAFFNDWAGRNLDGVEPFVSLPKDLNL